MTELSHEEIKHHVKIYIGVFVALAFFTIVTVAIAGFHLPFVLAVTVALLIATIKGSLVATFFMHLGWEKSIIYWILILTLTVFIGLLIIPAISYL